MPITLPPISRRAWLQGCGATLLGALPSWKAEAAATSQTWVLFSDTHIAKDRDLVARGAHLSKHLEQAVHEVLQMGEKPFGVLVNGDCAYKDGQPEDYALFVELMNPLRDARIQIHCTLGNHDDRTHFRAALVAADEKPLLPDKHVEVVSSALCNWVLIDSLDQVDHVSGLLGEGQLRWLDRTLRALPEKPTIIMGHHNPQGPVPDGGKKTGLVDSDAMFEILASHKKVQCYVYGHTHTWLQTTHAGTGLPMINLPPVAYAFSEGRPSGWVTAHTSSDGVEFKLSSLDKRHKEHGQTKRIEWRNL